MNSTRHPIEVKSLDELLVLIEDAFLTVQTEDCREIVIPGIAALRTKNRWWAIEGFTEIQAAGYESYYGAQNNPDHLNSLVQFTKDMVKMGVDSDGLTILSTLSIACNPESDGDDYIVVGMGWASLLPQPVEEPIT
jgi:hypothetical protein